MSSRQGKNHVLGSPSPHVRALLGVFCAFMAFGAVGCYEIHEEVWIQDDGTVHYALDYAIPEWVIVATSQVDGGNADSVLALIRHPAAMLVEGDSVLNREFLDRDLRHFVSERRMSSPKRWLEIAARGEAHYDSILHHIAVRDSISKAMSTGTSWERREQVLDSLRKEEARFYPDSSNAVSPAGYVLGHYEQQSNRDGSIRIRHLAFPKPTKARLVE